MVRRDLAGRREGARERGAARRGGRNRGRRGRRETGRGPGACRSSGGGWRRPSRGSAHSRGGVSCRHGDALVMAAPTGASARRARPLRVRIARWSRRSSGRAPAGPAERCSAFGRRLTGEPLEWGRLANENPPKLRTHDRFGARIDEVEFHPAWHELMRLSSAQGAALALVDRGRATARTSRARRCFMLAARSRRATVPDLDDARRGARAARLGARSSRRVGAAADVGETTSATAARRRAARSCGMAMTERQGGSDVRANTTRGTAVGGGEYVARRRRSGSARHR